MPPRTHRSRKSVSYSRAQAEVHLQRARHGISDDGQCTTQLAIQKKGQAFSNVMLCEFVESRCRAGLQEDPKYKSVRSARVRTALCNIVDREHRPDCKIKT